MLPKEEKEKDSRGGGGGAGHGRPVQHGGGDPEGRHRRPDHQREAAEQRDQQGGHAKPPSPGHPYKGGSNRDQYHKQRPHPPAAPPPAPPAPAPAPAHGKENEDLKDEEAVKVDMPEQQQQHGGEAQKVVVAKEPAPAPSSADDKVWHERAQAVKEAFVWSWEGYRKYAWGYDQLLPLSQRGEDWFGLGLTITDSMSTMWIMNLTEEFNAGRDWIASDLKFAYEGDVSLVQEFAKEMIRLA